MPYLRLDSDSPEAVEELEWRHDLALHQRTRQYGSGGPPSRAEGHLPEPCLEGESALSSESASPISHHLVHDSSGETI